MDKVLAGLEILSKVFDQQSSPMVTRLLQQQVGLWGGPVGSGLMSGAGGTLLFSGLRDQSYPSSVQNPAQTGEQELESLVLKLSVLKDFLSGIQKKVAWLLTSDLTHQTPTICNDLSDLLPQSTPQHRPHCQPSPSQSQLSAHPLTLPALTRPRH